MTPLSYDSDNELFKRWNGEVRFHIFLRRTDKIGFLHFPAFPQQPGLDSVRTPSVSGTCALPIELCYGNGAVVLQLDTEFLKRRCPQIRIPLVEQGIDHAQNRRLAVAVHTVDDRDSVIELHADIVVEHAKQTINADSGNPHWLYLVVAFAIHTVVCNSPGNFHLDPPSMLVHEESWASGRNPERKKSPLSARSAY